MIELYYRIMKHDPDGVLVKDTGLIPSGSYVIQFLEMMRGYFDALTITATDTSGAETVILKHITAINKNSRVDAPALNANYGIVVGTNAGTTAEDNENYALDTKILHSAVGDAGKMNYRDVIFVASRVVGPNVDLDIIRPFINETVATITVKEIGLICYGSYEGKYHLLLRDVVSDEDVEADYTLTVAYTLRTTV